MKTQNVLDGVAILRKYADSEWAFAAEHDVLYFATDRPLSPEDETAVRGLGWLNEDDNEDAEPEIHASAGPWFAFV